VVGNPKRPRTGAFEITDSLGNTYHSKLSGQGFPDMSKVIDAMVEAGHSRAA